LEIEKFTRPWFLILVEDLDQILDPEVKENQVTLKNAFILTMDPGKIQIWIQIQADILRKFLK